MTARAEFSLPGDPGLGFDWIHRVSRRGAVTGLAGEPAMIRSRLTLHDLTVAERAFLLSCILLRVGDDGVQCGGSKVPALPESFGHEEVSSQDQCQARHGKHHDEAWDLLGHAGMPQAWEIDHERQRLGP